MSQAPKRPGSRDISDLKARLGLKKKSPASPPGSITPPAGLAPPPGAVRGGVPAPPGAAPPAPAAPVIPDAQHDPFGAMNAMAAHSAAAAAPAIVVVNDGQPVEGVGQPTNALRIAKIAGMILVPLIFGAMIGKVSAAANSYNKTIHDAAAIRDDLDKNLKPTLTAFSESLQLARERGPGGNEFLLNDTKLTEDLAAIKFTYADPKLALESHLHNMSPELISDLLGIYTDTNTVYKLIQEHVKQSQASAQALSAGSQALQKAAQSGYAAYLQMPSGDEGKLASVKLVQLGLPICAPNGQPNPEGCGAQPPTAFQFRTDELGQWGIKPVTNIAGDMVAGNRLVLLDPSTPVFQQLVKGGEASTAEVAYMARLKAIDESLGLLVQLRNDVAARLNNTSHQGTKFTFFL